MDDSTELDPMSQMANDLDDLGNLFEFGDIDLNNIPDAGDFGGQMQQHGTHPNTPFQDLSEAPSMGGTAAHDFGGHDQYGLGRQMDHSQQQHYMRQRDKHAPTSNPYTVDAIYQASVQQAMYQPPQPYQMHHQQHVFPPNQHVPPTPNSFDMHGEPGRFMQQHSHMDPQQRAIMEQRYGLRKDDAIAFTPMVSPAGTPQFNMLPEYTTPGAYFSPLTSPMLHAQQQQHAHLQHQHQQGYMTNPSTAPSSNTNSPIDPNIDVDMLGDSMQLPESAGPQPRKSRRKIATPRSATTRGQQKQQAKSSQKRKSTSPNEPTSANGSRPTARSQPSSATLQTPGQVDSSEAESISPEPLSENLMGPPPKPGSVNQSPNLVGLQRSQTGPAMGPAATPKSLLTMRSQQPISDQPTASLQDLESAQLDDLSLPAAAKQNSRRPSLSQINTQIALPTGEEDTPRLSARKTPKLGPLSTPSSARPSSALESPAMGSPMTATTPSAILNKKDAKNGKAKQKRGSMSANGSKLVSPALVPKISPSIKPLLPEGTPLNSAQQAMLLASKSNYQNLVEGNRLPGVNYPDSLSTGLTSKRTSHKVAEQGRRNRINEALKEMQSLIPKSTNSSRSPNGGADESAVASPEALGEEKDGEGGKLEKEDSVSKSNSSKAATVELANEYIKRMMKEKAGQEAEMLMLRRENEELKRRLGVEAGAEEDGDGEGEEMSTASSPVKA